MQGFVDRSSGLNQCVRMNVSKLLLQESGSYNPQYRRPYEMHADGRDIANIVNRIAEHGTGQITGQLLSGAAGQILAPTATVGSEIHIPNGWLEKRVRFVLEVQCDYGFSTVVYYIQGYTNFNGITHTAIAPDMVFIINSVQAVTRTSMMSPSGLQVMDIPKESFQVIGDADRAATMNETKFLMRPHDVFTGMHTEYIKNATGISDYGVVDNRAQLRSDAVRSSRSYGLPTNYIAKVVDNFTQATQMLEFGQTDQDALSRARESSFDSLLNENPFIRRICDIKGFGAGNSFTYNDLMTIDPGTHNVTTILVAPAIHQMQIHQAGQTAYWHGSDRLTQVATILSQAVPAIMMDLLLSKFRFRVTNHDIGGMVNFAIIDAKGLTNMDLTRNLLRFEDRLKSEVLFDISFGNQDSYLIEMAVDMFGETAMDITMYGQTVRYVTPSFCDNLTVPVLAGTADQFNGLVHNFDILLHQVNGELTNTQAPARPIRI